MPYLDAEYPHSGPRPQSEPHDAVVAAAPLLLAAVRTGLQWSESDGCPDDDILVTDGEREFRRLARAALKQAEGRVE